MPFHGDVRDFGVVVIGAGPAGTTAAELDGVLGYSAALVEQDIDGGAESAGVAGWASLSGRPLWSGSVSAACI